MPMSHVAETLKDRGHTVTIVCMDNSKGRESCPKLFDKMNISYKLTKASEIEDAGTLDNYVMSWKESCI